MRINYGALLAIGVLTACSNSATPQYGPEPGLAEPELRPGDAIRLQVWREADLTGVFAVDDRGVVTLPLVGEYAVAGLPPADLRLALVERYRQYLQNPSIEVTVLRRISILGEVRSPGVYQVDPTVSLFDALALAGGLTPNGDSNKIQLIRGEATVAEHVPPSSVIGSTPIRSGDQLVVGQKGWVARNTGAIVGSFIAATAIVAAAVISSNN